MFSFFFMISAMVLFIITYTAALTGPSCSLHTLALDSNSSRSSEHQQQHASLSNGFPRDFSMADLMQLHREEAEKARQHSKNLIMLVKNQSDETLAKFVEQMNCSMNAGFAALNAKVGALAADVDALAAGVDALAAGVDALAAGVDALAAGVAAVRTELRDGFSAANDDRERIRLNVSSAKTRTDSSLP
jgi:X-X-X-Leu-X-X-Gly heptad repeat protein